MTMITYIAAKVLNCKRMMNVKKQIKQSSDSLYTLKDLAVISENKIFKVRFQTIRA